MKFSDVAYDNIKSHKNQGSWSPQKTDFWKNHRRVMGGEGGQTEAKLMIKL